MLFCFYFFFAFCALIFVFIYHTDGIVLYSTYLAISLSIQQSKKLPGTQNKIKLTHTFLKMYESSVIITQNIIIENSILTIYTHKYSRKCYTILQSL